MRHIPLKNTLHPSLLLIAAAALSTAALTGCANAGIDDEDVAPDLFNNSPDDAPAERGTFTAEFIVRTSPKQRSITIERARPPAPSPSLGAESIDSITIGNDDIEGAGPDNTVELVTNSTGSNAECPAPYILGTFCANVTARHFFARTLPNSFLQVTSVEPPTGHGAVNSDPSEFGLSNANGLWKYTTSTAASGVLGQAPLNDAARDWVFNDPDGADTAYQLQFVASLAYASYTAPFAGAAYTDACTGTGAHDIGVGTKFATVTMPFPFTLYSTTSSSVSISERGTATFGGGPVSTGENVLLPSAAAPASTLFAFWDDVGLKSGSGHMCYKTTGAAPNRKFLINWVNLDFKSAPDAGSNLTFGVTLSEGTNKIELAYSSMTGPTTRKNGASATVGVQNATGTVGFGRFNSAIFTTNKKFPLSPAP